MTNPVEEFQTRLLAVQELGDRVRSTGQRLTVTSSGHVLLFHSTSQSNVDMIQKSGEFLGNTWFASSKSASLAHAKPKHGSETVTLQVAVDAQDIEFSTGTGEFYAPNGLHRTDLGHWIDPVQRADASLQRAKNAQDFVEDLSNRPSLAP